MEREGILKRKEGFEIRNDVYRIRIPQGTKVRFIYKSGCPTILFEGFDIKLMKVNNQWLADVWGCIMSVQFDSNNPPYPVLFFEKKRT